MTTQTIYIWPDNSWCYREDLEDMLSFNSDDFMRIEMPESFDDAQVALEVPYHNDINTYRS